MCTALFGLLVQAVPSGPVLQGGCDVSDFTSSIQCVGIYSPGNVDGQASIFDDAIFKL